LALDPFIGAAFEYPPASDQSNGAENERGTGNGGGDKRATIKAASYALQAISQSSSEARNIVLCFSSWP